MNPSYLILKSGEVFQGYSPEKQNGLFFGEVVFNTSMVGYVEALTDPSYCNQILTFSYPLIGNYGVDNGRSWESAKIQVAGMVCSELSYDFSHHCAQISVQQWLEDQNVPMMWGVDTRALVKCLRNKGVVAGVISSTRVSPKQFIDVNQEDLVAKVSCTEVIETGIGDKKVVVVDCGIKQNILRCLDQYPIRIKRVPYNYDYTSEDYDGLFISNGPGDPSMCKETIATLKKAMNKDKPIFGICLGAQLMSLAIGARTYKLPFGHRAQNHPCMDLRSRRCYLTSQNHGFAIEEKSLPKDWHVTFKNLNDNTVQGIAHIKKPFFSVQFHPEAAPGPFDTYWLFDKFYELL